MSGARKSHGTLLSKSDVDVDIVDHGTYILIYLIDVFKHEPDSKFLNHVKSFIDDSKVLLVRFTLGLLDGLLGVAGGCWDYYSYT